MSINLEVKAGAEGGVEMGIACPITVTKIEHTREDILRPQRLIGQGSCGDWIAVRPCGERYGDKTYLGVFLGEMAQTTVASFNPETGRMTVGAALHNPAIFVPDLKEVIYGLGSWWRLITSPDDLAKITDADIDNVWYMRALRELDERQLAEGEDT